MRTLLFLHLFILPCLLDAQSRGLKRARHFVSELNYEQATKHYEQALKQATLGFCRRD